MSHRYDVIVIGSGFGGAVTAARLAEGGARVLVLERGRRWTPDQYPRGPTDPWMYGHRRPHKQNGWFDLRIFRRMVVVQGAGVGGGSLCYSSVTMEATSDLFDARWPAEITYDELRPYYRRVADMLKVRPLPAGQQTPRGRLLGEAADKLGFRERMASVPLAVSFDDDWSYELADPLGRQHSKEYVNEHGQRQGTCIHLGNCDIGCDVRAKNSLDVNYIPLAERQGAEIRPLHVVRRLEPEAGGGYRVVFERIEGGRLIPGTERAAKVVLAAGSIGTTELLLRCRDEYGTLGNISPLLGKRWSPNANLLSLDVYSDAGRVMQGVGPTISTNLDFMDRGVDGERFSIQDDGFPNVLYHSLTSLPSGMARALGRGLTRKMDERNPTRRVMVWLGEGIDAGDGVLRLARRRLAPWKRDIDLEWRFAASRGVADAIAAMHGRISNATGSRLSIPLFSRRLNGAISMHPLGGCGMGRDASAGVVDHTGQVFGHPNLFVADGSILPTPVGRNPSMTIAALSERIARLIMHD